MCELRVLWQVIASERWEDGEYRMMASFTFSSAHKYYSVNYIKEGDRGRVAQWLRCCATNRKVAGSNPDGPGVDSASNRNEYQEHFLGLKAAGAYG